MSRVGLLSVATASPAHPLPQAEAKRFAASFFAEDFSEDSPEDSAEDSNGDQGDAQSDAQANEQASPELARLLESYDKAGVDNRQLGRPITWLEQPRSFPEKNAAYVEQAKMLARRAGGRALAMAGIDAAQVGGVIFASSTGVATPSLDAQLIQDLDLPRDCMRTPLWGLGCAGGGAALGRAVAMARGLQKPVLVVACELCSLTFVHADRRKANLIAVALFGDGAAAAVVAPEPWWDAESPQGPELLAPYARLIDQSEHIMGWDLEDQGLRVRFAPTIPSLVLERGAELFAEAAAKLELAAADIRHPILHPGGRKVLDAFERAWELEPEQLRHAREVLRDHGNMSSPTALFVLERFLADNPARGEAGLLLALGPGFCAEGVGFRW